MLGPKPAKTDKTIVNDEKKITKEELEKEYPDGIPPEYNPDLLPNLSRHQVVFFDEMHVE